MCSLLENPRIYLIRHAGKVRLSGGLYVGLGMGQLPLGTANY